MIDVFLSEIQEVADMRRIKQAEEKNAFYMRNQKNDIRQGAN